MTMTMKPLIPLGLLWVGTGQTDCRYHQRRNFYDELERTGRPQKLAAADRCKIIKMVNSGGAADAAKKWACRLYRSIVS
ncbi:hypothetical protein DL96DRAFT_1628445, partial [Flagelloscypha sp. PMI_526]